MKMLLLGLSLAALAACATPSSGPGGGEYRPSPTTNDVARLNLNLAIEYMRRGEYENALQKLERARLADPKYPLTYNTFGLLYQQLGDPEQAERSYKKALQLDPNDAPALNNYGRFLCQRNRAQEAEAAFLKAANNPLYETPEIPLTNAGVCAANSKRPEQAETFFRKALGINPNVPGALLHMAKLSLAQGKYLPARGFLQRYADSSKHTAESLWLGIQIERQLGGDDVVSSYALALRINHPDSEETRQLDDAGIK